MRAALAAAALRFFFSIWACERDGHEGVDGRTPARDLLRRRSSIESFLARGLLCGFISDLLLALALGLRGLGLRPAWKSNFGRPTPSTRRCLRDRVGSLVDFRTVDDVEGLGHGVLQCWRLYARRLAPGVRARLWVIAEAIADRRIPVFLALRSYTVFFGCLASFLVSYWTSFLTARSACQRPHGLIIARLTQR